MPRLASTPAILLSLPLASVVEVACNLAEGDWIRYGHMTLLTNHVCMRVRRWLPRLSGDIKIGPGWYDGGPQVPMRFCFTNAGPTSGAYSTTEYPSRFKVTPYPCTGGSDEDRTFYIYRDAVGHSPLQVRLSTPIGTQIYTPLNCHGSFAPLSNVIRASTFTDPRRGYYRGLLFHYSNGGQRALGQCRVGFDPMSEFRNPATLCFRVGLSTDGLQRAWVGLGDVEHDHDERHTCYQMGRGRLGFWTEPRGITGLDVVGGRLVGE